MHHLHTHPQLRIQFGQIDKVKAFVQGPGMCLMISVVVFVALVSNAACWPVIEQPDDIRGLGPLVDSVEQ